MTKQRVIPRDTLWQAAQIRRDVRRVGVHKVKITQIRRNHTPLRIRFILAQAEAGEYRRSQCQHRCAGIAGAVGVIPNACKPRQIQFALTRLQLRLLQAVNIRVQPRESIQQRPVHQRPKAVDIPRNQLHFCSLPVSQRVPLRRVGAVAPGVAFREERRRRVWLIRRVQVRKVA